MVRIMKVHIANLVPVCQIKVNKVWSVQGDGTAVA